MQTNNIDRDLLRALEPGEIKKRELEQHVQPYNALVEKLAQSQKKHSPAEFVRLFTLQWRLGPIAYDGNALAGRVALLVLNPNFADDATPESHYRPDPECPLAALSSRATLGTQKYYRETVFKHLLQHYEAKDLAAKFLKIELSPWASRKFPTMGKLVRALEAFPSTSLTVKFVEQLVSSGAVIAVMKGVGHWPRNVPMLVPLIGLQAFKNSAPIGNYLTPKTMGELGWRAILNALEE